MATAEKKRLDQLLVERGLADSGSRARALIMAGLVYSGTRRLDKAGVRLAQDARLDVRGRGHPWASRGGIKLAHGLDHFRIDPQGLACLDVGRGQLAWKLRGDERVIVLERTNARHLTRDMVPDPVALIVCDVSFIGLETALPAPLALAAPGAWLVALIKPQFEVGKGRVGKGGVVRDADLHREVCGRIRAWLADRPGWCVLGVTESPITGPRGNREFLIAGRLRD